MIIHTDGGSRGNPGKAAAAFVVVGEDGNIIYREGKYLGETTNNQAEYQAVLMALSWLQVNPAEKVLFKMDSQLAVNQLTGIYKIKDLNILEKVKEIHKQIKQLPNVHINFMYVPREQNKEADKKVNEILDQS